MLEKKLQQMGLSMTIGVATDIYGVLPSIAKLIERAARYRYYESVLAGDIDHEGNVGIITCDEQVADKIKDGLIASNIPFCIESSDKVHAEVRRFQKETTDKDEAPSGMPSQDELQNEKIRVTKSLLEKNGKYTIFLPSSYVRNTLTDKQIDAYLSADNQNEACKNLLPEDKIALPPAGGCTRIDIILANIFIKELREEYGIKIKENEQEKEKDGKEKEEDLERERGEEDESAVDQDTEQEEKTKTPDAIVAGFSDDVQNAVSKEKKKKGKTKEGSSRSKDRDESRNGHEENRVYERDEHDSTSEDVDYYKSVDHSDHHEERDRMGGMSTSENLAHDSFRHQEELKKEFELEQEKEETKKETVERTRERKREETKRPFDEHENASGSETPDEEKRQQRINASGDRYERKEEQERYETRKRTDDFSRAQRNAVNDKNADTESGEKPYTKTKSEQEQKASSRMSGMSVNENLAHDSFRSHYNAKTVHFDDSQKTIVEHHSAGDLSGNKKTSFKAGQEISETIGRASGKREILFKSFSTENTSLANAIANTASETRPKRGTALTRPIKEAVKSATMGDGTEGGEEAEKYRHNTAPVGRFIAQEAAYGRRIARASETMHDGDVWAKAYAAYRGEPNTIKAEEFIDTNLKNAGIDPKSLNGKNIVEVQDILDSVNTNKATISRMSDSAMNGWLRENGGDLSEGLKQSIDHYRKCLNDVNNLKKPDSHNAAAMKQYRSDRADRQKAARNALKDLSNATTSTRSTIQQMKEEIDRLQKEIGNYLSKSNNMAELIQLLKDNGYSSSVMDGIRNVSFDALKNSDAIELINKEFGYEGLSKKIQSTAELQKLVYEGKIASIGELIKAMDSSAFGAFLKSQGLSQDIIDKLLKMGKNGIILKPESLNLLILQATGSDKLILQNLQNILNGELARPSSHLRLGKGVIKKIAQNSFGDGEGANALWETSGYLSNAQRITQTGIKISLNVSNRLLGEDAIVSRGLRAAAHPAKFAGRKLAGTAAGKAITNSRAAMKSAKIINNTRRLMHAPGRFVGKTSRAAAKGLGKLISTGAKNVAGAIGKVFGIKVLDGAALGSAASTAGTAAGTAAGGGAAVAGTLAGGWVIVVIILVIMLVMALINKSNERDVKTSGNYQYTQFDTDFQTEILNELQNLNDSFEESVNRAATDRTFWSGTTGFSETDSVTHYESGAYSVHFRDAEGNELDHLDINNSKAILDLATQYCKYADWIKPDANASDETKLAYEQIKQYYLDYCKFLWVATHRITLEEYRPGDSKHADDDQSGLVTNAQGICPKDGIKVWLQKDFTPGKIHADEKDYVCGVDNGHATNSEGTCNLLTASPFDDVYRDYGEYALCTHPLEGKKDGWSIVTDGNNNPVTRTHYICPSENGHKCEHCFTYEEDSNGKSHKVYEYHNCGEICPSTQKVFYIEGHKHTDYQWEYNCGGHMGAVIYITVGDVNRLKDMTPAKDIDINDLSNYPDNSNDVYIDQNLSGETLVSPTESDSEN